MPSKKPPTPDPAKVARAATAEAAALEARLAAEAAIAVAQRTHEEAEALRAEAHAEEEAWYAAVALANHDQHLLRCEKIRGDIHRRCHAHPARTEEGHVHVDPATIEVIAIDGSTHRVVERAALRLGHKGHGDACRAAVRFKLACGLATDTPLDELMMERFDQENFVDCPICLEGA